MKTICSLRLAPTAKCPRCLGDAACLPSTWELQWRQEHVLSYTNLGHLLCNNWHFSPDWQSCRAVHKRRFLCLQPSGCNLLCVQEGALSHQQQTAVMAEDFVVLQSFWHEEQGGRCLQGSVLRCSQPAPGDDRGFILPMSRGRFPCHGRASSGDSWTWGALLLLFFWISAQHDCGELREWRWVRSASFNQVRPPPPALRALRHVEPVCPCDKPCKTQGESKRVESCLWRHCGPGCWVRGCALNWVG